MASDRLVWVLACDIARMEAGNKGLLIGTYGTGIVVKGFPAVIPSLAFVGCFRAKRKRENVRITIRLPGVEQPTTHNADAVAPNRGDTHTIAMQLIPCTLKTSGKIEVKFEFDNGDADVLELDVMTESQRTAGAWDQ